MINLGGKLGNLLVLSGGFGLLVDFVDLLAFLGLARQARLLRLGRADHYVRTVVGGGEEGLLLLLLLLGGDDVADGA